MAALESVFSLEDLKVFVALPRSEKIIQLNELMQITSGVRLFNRDCKKGGEGIPDRKHHLIKNTYIVFSSFNDLLASRCDLFSYTYSSDLPSLRSSSQSFICYLLPSHRV